MITNDTTAWTLIVVIYVLGVVLGVFLLEPDDKFPMMWKVIASLIALIVAWFIAWMSRDAPAIKNTFKGSEQYVVPSITAICIALGVGARVLWDKFKSNNS